MPNKKRDDFDKKVKTRAALRVNFLCSNPMCRRMTTFKSDENSSGFSNIGVAAHICAASPGGPRYDANMTKTERRGIDNCIWLCNAHAKIIDDDEKTYTVDVLKGWKRETEEFVANKVSALKQYIDNGVELFEQWYEKFEIGNWDKITEMLLRPCPMILESRECRFLQANIWLDKNVHNIHDEDLQNRLLTFKKIWHEILKIVNNYFEPYHNILRLTPDRHNGSLYKSKDEYDEVETLIFELGFELTKCINGICDRLRNDYCCAFAFEKVNALFTGNILEVYRSFIFEYKEKENQEFDMQQFLADRNKRIKNLFS